jgi:hypothetical protein
MPLLSFSSPFSSASKFTYVEPRPMLLLTTRHSPISSYWEFALHKNCINEGVHVFVAGIINTITDFILVFLPMKLVLSLGLPRRQQYIAIGLFAAGLLASVAGVVRTVFTAFMFTNNDRIWNAWAVQLSGSIELFIGIVSYDTYVVDTQDVQACSFTTFSYLRSAHAFRRSSSFSRPISPRS